MTLIPSLATVLRGLLLAGCGTIAAIFSQAGRSLAAEFYLNSYGWSNVYRFDSTTGAVTQLPATNILDAGFASAAVFGPDGAMYGAGAFEIYRVTFSGAHSTWSTYLEVDDIASDGIAFDAQNRLYAANGDDLNRVNAAGQTEWSVRVRNGSDSLFLSGIGFAPDGQLWATDIQGVYRVNLANGAATPVVDVYSSTHGIITASCMSEDGVLIALSSFDYLYTYDTATGVGGWSSEPLEYAGSSFAPSSVAVRGLVNPQSPDADFNDDGSVDGLDYLTWQRGAGLTNPEFTDGDADHDGLVGGSDLAIWRAQYGSPPTASAIPEPPAAALALATLLVIRGRCLTQRQDVPL